MTSERRPSGVLARARRVAGRLLGRPSSDWAGPDPASEIVARASPIPADHWHDVVSFEASGADVAPGLTAFAEAGHRVFRVLGEAAHGGAPFEHVARSDRLWDVRLAEPAFESLDRLRRDLGLGATVSLLSDGWRRGLAERLQSERGWPLIDRAGPGAPAADALPSLAVEAFPLASVVIVTYNRRDLNRICLESLLARTEWPRFEIVVVDNGSSDGTPELLADLAGRHAALRVVALAENRGFPHGCNRGVAESRGDVLVLLNNDTVVPRGWLTALHRRLATDPELGLVGPVTNAIANEARIDVGYRTLDEMPAWAASWVRDHDGETFDIPMLAFFCVAMRRETWEAVGSLDERFGLGLFEDGDYNRRVRAAGRTIRCARDAFVHHWQNASFRRLGRDAYFALYEENRRKFEAKWGSAPAPRESGER
jgi:GT2 family glycosyltransferase